MDPRRGPGGCTRAVALAALIAFGPRVALTQDKPAPKAAPRILFVIDVETEQPLAGAQVHDMITGNSMNANAGGAVGLLVPAFVKKSGAMIEVRMPGYLPSARMFVDPTETEAIVFALLKEDSPRARPIERHRSDSTLFRVEVLDETGGPMTDATVAIVRGLSTALASRVTDSAGFRMLGVPEVKGDVQITVQKVGYAPYRQFYNLSVADTVEAQVAMFPVAQQLNAVTVTAKRRIYHLDDNEIANSKRPLVDALDAIRKLRPAMFGDRTRGMEGCGTADYIFVNGRRITGPPQNADLSRVARERVPIPGTRGRTMSGVGRRPAPRTPSGEAAASDAVRGVLAGIKPEHIAEMTYLDCFDTSVPGLHTHNAIYVVLKFGIEYDDRHGSRLSADSTKRK